MTFKCKPCLKSDEVEVVGSYSPFNKVDFDIGMTKYKVEAHVALTGATDGPMLT